MFAGFIHEIDSDITQFQQLLTKSSQSDPLRLISVFGLAITLFQRHGLLNQRKDLDKSIFHFTESILLPPRSWPLGHSPLILQALFFLASALLKRSNESNQPEDATYAAKYLRHLRDQPHAAFRFPRHAVTTMLVDVLAFQVKLEARNAVQNIEEMAVLCHELLTSDASDCDTTRPITVFIEAVFSIIRLSVPDQPSNQVIEFLRATRKHKPNLLGADYALVLCLCLRYL